MRCKSAHALAGNFENGDSDWIQEVSARQFMQIGKTHSTTSDRVIRR